MLLEVLVDAEADALGSRAFDHGAKASSDVRVYAPAVTADVTDGGRQQLIIDVDTGIDDALALLYACASAEADILAVTCVSGNVDARQVAANTLAVLELAGRDDVEVALGREVPLVRPLMTAPETHGPKGIGYAELPSQPGRVSERHAADLIIAEARQPAG